MYGIRPEIYEAFAEQPLRKIVAGQHVFGNGNLWKVKSGRSYAWSYTLKNPVIPGDMLKVKTKKGQAFICVNNKGGRKFTGEKLKIACYEIWAKKRGQDIHVKLQGAGMDGECAAACNKRIFTGLNEP